MRSVSQERERQPGSGSNCGAATLDRFTVLPNCLSDLSLFFPLAHFRMQDLSSLTRDEAALPEVEVRGPHHRTTSPSVQFSRSVMSDSATPWTAARQASLSITNSQGLLKLMSLESVMPSNHLILCRPLLLIFLFNSAATLFIPRKALGSTVSQSPGALARHLPRPPFPHTPHSTCHVLHQTCLKLAGNQSLPRGQATGCFSSLARGGGCGAGGIFKQFTIDIC